MQTTSNWLITEKEEPIVNGFFQYGPGKGMRKQVFEAFDVTGKTVKKLATIDPVRKKIILMQPKEESLYKSGLKEKGVSGYLYLYAHANKNSIQGMKQGYQIGKVIRESGIWHGEPILIDACSAGQQVFGGIASLLTINLQTYVTAPNISTWNYPLGGAAIGQGAFNSLPGILSKLPFPDLTRPGEWRTWGPDGQLIATTRTSPRDSGRPVQQ